MPKIQNKSKLPNGTTKDTLMKKQWSKYISKGDALSLMYYNPDSKLFKSYKNTSYCAETILTNENAKINTTYCKNRWCRICNRIKTARLINSYLPQVQNLFQPVFLTLTLPTVNADNLVQRISDMEKLWRLLYNKSKNAKYKKTYSPLKGIRKAETTIRPNGQYHYHFHFILDNWASAEWLLNQWLKYNPTASEKAQDLRFANEYAHKELFKYAFKSEVKMDCKTNAQRYDVVFTALRNKRTYQAFGGIKKIEEDFDENDLENGITLDGYANKIFTWVTSDWYDKSTGEALVDLPIPTKVKAFTNYPDERSEKNKIQAVAKINKQLSINNLTPKK